MALKFDSTVNLGSLIKVGMGIIAAAILYGRQEQRLDSLEGASLSQIRSTEKLTDGFNALSITEARLSAIVENDHDTLKQRMSRRVEEPK